MGLITPQKVKIKWHQTNKRHYEKLGYVFTKWGDEFEVKVEDLTKGSKVRVECICDNCKCNLKPYFNDYNKIIREDKKTYCNNCAKKIYGVKNANETKLKNSKSFELWCIENDRQDILDRWDYELNDCSPKEVCYRTGRKFWFKCSKHKEHHSELKSLSSFAKGIAKNLDCSQCNSIGQYIIDNFGEDFLWKVWSDKNEKSPFEYSFSSNKKIWWKCLDNKHKDYERKISSSMKSEYRCPECILEREESIIEEKTRLYLEELGYEVKTEWECSLILKNPKKDKGYFRFDNEITLKNGKHLIIEVHGSQHYKVGGIYMKDEKELMYQQWKDKYKKEKCLELGYEYLEIPYTAFNKEQKYKTLINKKIINCFN